MRPFVPILLSAGLLLGMATAQTMSPTANGAPARPSPAVSGMLDEASPGKSGADDMQQLNADVQRLKVLLNQMPNSVGTLARRSQRTCTVPATLTDEVSASTGDPARFRSIKP